MSGVLVVGAGPTGLTVANELARRGIQVRIVDASPHPDSGTRALGIQARTLELFERLDLTEPAIDAGLRTTQFHIRSEDREILHLDLRRLDSPYPFVLMLPQNDVERLLAARLVDYDIAVERGITLTGMWQDSAGVTAELRHGDGTTESVRTDWLIGCDGVHSTVREIIDVPFYEETYRENVAVADLRVDWPLPYDEMYTFLNRGHVSTFCPMRGGVHRVVTTAPGTDASDWMPAGCHVLDIRKVSRYEIDHRSVQSYSDRHIVLAGDAAHIQSVAGAQGMNAGIQDGFSLGWRLALVIRGLAHPRLIDGYGIERGSVAHRLVNGPRSATRVTLMGNPAATAARRLIAPHLLTRPHVRHALAPAAAQIDVSYDHASGEGRDDRDNVTGYPTVGDRAPDARVEPTAMQPGSRLHELLDLDGYTLLVFGDIADLAPVLSKYPQIGQVLHIAGTRTDIEETHICGDIGARYGVSGNHLVLIRPDGYIAFRGTDADGLYEYLRHTLE